jgi:hypothetical protein
VDDNQIRVRIEELVAEEHRLWDDEAAGSSSTEDARGLAEAKVTLDELWDLLRQRRALRAAGQDPGAAELRDERTVESYEQ